MSSNTGKRDSQKLSIHAIARTVKHLFYASNELQSTAPTVSRHLSHALVSAISPSSMSLFARRIHCKACGALMTLASTRVIQVLRHPRRGGHVHNAVMRRCRHCGSGNIEDGIEHRVGRKEGRLLEDINVLREETKLDNIKEKRKTNKDDESADVTQQYGLRLVHGSMKKKKKKRKKKKDSDACGQAEAELPPGLAASFLFKPL